MSSNLIPITGSVVSKESSRSFSDVLPAWSTAVTLSVTEFEPFPAAGITISSSRDLFLGVFSSFFP